eukprot:475300-Rhodomonas_salina.1
MYQGILWVGSPYVAILPPITRGTGRFSDHFLVWLDGSNFHVLKRQCEIERHLWCLLRHLRPRPHDGLGGPGYPGTRVPVPGVNTGYP